MTDADRRVVVDSVQAVVQAVFDLGNRRDAATQMKLYAGDPDVRIVDNGKVYMTPASYRATLDTLFQAITALAMKPTEVRTTVLGPDAAATLVPFTMVITAKDGRSVPAEGVWTALIQKRPEGWRIMESHESELNLGDVMAQLFPSPPSARKKP